MNRRCTICYLNSSQHSTCKYLYPHLRGSMTAAVNNVLAQAGFRMFHGWENFYIMAGTAAATLAGLLFVVITLSVSLAATPAARGVHAFVTPVLVHFGGVLFLALVLLAPWPSAWPVGLILSLHGLAGISYAAFIIRLLRKLDFVSLQCA